MNNFLVVQKKLSKKVVQTPNEQLFKSFGQLKLLKMLSKTKTTTFCTTFPFLNNFVQLFGKVVQKVVHLKLHNFLDNKSCSKYIFGQQKLCKRTPISCSKMNNLKVVQKSKSCPKSPKKL